MPSKRKPLPVPAPEAAPEAVPALPVPAPEAAPEAVPAPELSRAERIAAGRTEAARLIRALDAGRVSVPLKPALGFKRKPLTLNRPLGGLNPSTRQAAALAVAIVASGQRVPVSADAAPVTFPRTFATDAGELCIENGAGCDALVSGLATADNAAGTLTVSASAGRVIAAHLGGLLPAEHRA